MAKLNSLQYLSLIDNSYLSASGIMRRFGVSRATAYNYLAALDDDQVKYTVNPSTHKQRRLGLASAVTRLMMTTQPGNPRCKDPAYQSYVAHCRWSK